MPIHAAQAEQLPLTISEQMDQSQIVVETLSLLPQDTFSHSILEALKGADLPKGWTFQTGLLLLNGKQYVPHNEHLCLQIIHNHHDHPTSGHLGQQKSIGLICHNYHWPGLGCMVRKYIQSCTICARAKATHMAYSNNSLSHCNHGTPFRWISLNNFRFPMASPLSL